MMANSITSLRAIARIDWRRFVERQSVIGGGAARRPGGRLPAHDLRHARPLPARGRADREADRARRSATVAAPAIELAARERRRRSAGRPARGHVGYYLIDDGPRRARARRPATGRRSREAVHRWVLRHPERCCSSAASRSARWRRSRAVLWLGGAGRRARRGSLVAAVRAASRRTTSRSTWSTSSSRRSSRRACSPSSTCATRRGSRRVPHGGRDPDALRQRRGGAARRWRISRCSSSPTAKRTCTSRCSATSPTRRPRRCRRRRRDRRRRGRRACARSTRATRDGRGDAFYLFHRPRRWNPSAGRLDGLGAQARQARASSTASCAAARGDAFSVDRGRRRRAAAACATSSRSTPTRCCRRDAAPLLDRHDGPSAQPRRVRRRDAAASCAATASCSRASACRCRARTARASPPSTPDIPASIRTRPPSRTCTRISTARGASPGKGIYDVDAFEQATHGRFPENTLLSHDLIEGSYARAGLVDRHRGLRRLSDALPRPTRGASTAGSAATGSSCRWLAARVPGPRRPGAQPALAALALEDRSTTCAAACVELAQLAFLVAGWTVLPGLAAALDAARRCGAVAAPWIVSLLLAAAAPAARQVVARLLRGGRARRVDQRCSSSALASSSCRIRRGSRPTPSCARCGALLGLADATCSSGRRRRRPSARRPARRARCGARMWPAVAIAVALAVVAARASRGRARSALRVAAGASACCRSSLLWLASPAIAHRAQRAARCAGSAGSPRRSARQALRYARAALALLRALRHRGDPLARAGQLPGRPGAGRRDAHVADEHRPPAARDGERARPRLHLAERDGRRGSSARFDSLERMRALPRALLQLVRPARTCACSSRRTSPRWTAATSPAICIALRQACLAIAQRRRRRAARRRAPRRASPSARDAYARRRWTSRSSSTRAQALLDRLPASARTRSTRRTTTCSPPRRGWRASSRSPRTTCRWSTGSGSAARSRTPAARPRSCRGAAACSST